MRLTLLFYQIEPLKNVWLYIIVAFVLGDWGLPSAIFSGELDYHSGSDTILLLSGGNRVKAVLQHIM